MTLTSIIDTSNKVPRAFVKVSLGAGPRSAGSAAMKVLALGSKTSAGTATVGLMYLVITADDAKTYFGQGSELHLAAILAFKANPGLVLYMAALDDSTGGAASTKTVAVTGTATSDGFLEVWIKGQRIVVSIATGDTATVIGAALVSAVGGQPACPMTGVNTTGSVAFTSRNKGARFNYISVRSKLTGAAGISHTPVTGYATSGSDTGADPQTILDSLAAERFHLIVAPYTDATNLGKFKTYCTAQLAPLVGKRARWIATAPTSISASVTISDTVNDPLGQVLQIENPDNLTLEIALVRAAMLTLVRSSDRAYNTDGQLLPGINPQFSQADVMIESELASCLNNGLTPLMTRTGAVYVCRDVTNYHNDTNSNDDFSIVDTHYVDVSIYMADQIEVAFASSFAGFKLAPDNADGEPIAPRVATPTTIKDYLFKLAKAQENVLLVNVDALKSSLIVELDGAAAGRANAEFPIDPIELFHQLAVNVAQL